MDKASPAGAHFVFISYSRANKAFVERLVADLHQRGVNCWIDQQGLKPGISDWEQALRDAIRASEGVLLVASREARQSRYVKAEIDVAEMYRRRILPVWVAGEQWIDSVPMGLSVAQFIDARGERYQAALDEIVGTVGRAEGEAILIATESEEDADFRVEPRNPYKGLRAFGEGDAGDFFGRTAVVDDLVAALGAVITETPATAAARLLAVVGPSGSGKSSVVMAGLLPRLKGGVLPGSADWAYLPPMVPGAHPVEAITLALAARLDRSMSAMRHDLDDDSARGLHLLACHLIRPPATRVVLVIDQFEELFTQAVDEDERRHFIDLLVAAVTEPRGPVVVVLTMRADFYHQTMRYADLWRIVEGHTRYIAPMTVEELREVIEGPARLPDTRLRFEGDLVGDLLFEVREGAGSLPLLQFALDQLFERREGRRLTQAAYRELGGVRGALARHAEETYAALPSDRHRALARALFLRLVEPGMRGTSAAVSGEATRRRVAMSELVLPDAAATAMLREVADAFIGARLLFTNAVGDTTTLEVSHEALLGGWPRLQAWIEEDRAGLLVHRALTEAAQEWERLGRDEGALYRGTRLATTAEWAEQAGPTLNETEAAFLQASLALQARERRAAQQRVRRTVGGLLAGLLAISIVAVFAVVQWHQATQAQAAAVAAQKVATSRELAANAVAQLGIDPELSLLLARQAALVSPTTEAQEALRQALLQSHVRLTFHGHDGPVNSATFSPNGALALTASDDGTARIWAARTGQIVRVLRVTGVAMRGAAFSPDGTRVATAGDDNTARLWNATTGAFLGALCRHRDIVNSVAFSPDGSLILTASEDGTAQVCAVAGGRSVRVLGSYGIGRGMTSAAFSPDGRLIATASADGTAAVWDAATGRRLRVLGQQAGSGIRMNGVAFSPNGKLLATASADNTAQLWTVSTGRLLHTLSGHAGAVNSVAFSRDGRLVVTAGADNTVRVWNASTGTELAVLRGHTDTVNGAAFSPDGRFIVTASSDDTARVWDTSTQVILSRLLWGTGTGRVMAAALSPDGTHVVTGDNDHTARIWQAGTGRLLRTLSGHTGPVTAVAFSPDGTRVLTVSGDGTAGLWDAATGRRLHTFGGGSSAVAGAAFSPDGTRIVTAGADSSVVLWDAASGKSVRVLNAAAAGPGAGMSTPLFSPDGSLVLALDAGQVAHVWDARTGTALATLIRTQGDLTFSPAGVLVTRVTTYGTARIAAARTGRPLAQPDFGSGVTSVAFSPDGRSIVIGSGSGTAASGTADVWTITSHQHVLTLGGQAGPVTAVAYSRDGRFIVAGSADGSADVWEAGIELAILRGNGPLTGVAFTPDATRVLVTDARGTAQVYACDVCGSLNSLVALAGRRVTRGLTPQERTLYLHEGTVQ